MIDAFIIVGILISIVSFGLVIYWGIVKDKPWALSFVFGAVPGICLIFFGVSLQNSPKGIEKEYLNLLENIEESKKELEHFYIDHPEFRLQSEKD